MTNLTPGETLTVVALSAFFALWVFALGANLGSFLNVVVYRLPRGMPLALSVSRCPKCANPIALRDNIPIISWLRLRGRCRSCGQTISPRYPLVEAAVGSLVLMIFAVELLTGGRNLPLRPPGKGGFLELFADMPWDLAGIAAAHACLLYLLLAVALIQTDRRMVPWKFVAIAVLVGVALAPFQLLTVEGDLSPALAAAAKPSGIAPRPAIYEFRIVSLFSAAAGLVCGAAWGLLYARVSLVAEVARLQPSGGRRRTAAARAMPLSMALVGLFLGWQAATSVALATGACGSRGPSRPSPGRDCGACPRRATSSPRRSFISSPGAGRQRFLSGRVPAHRRLSWPLFAWPGPSQPEGSFPGG